jgi:hypothetical protein
MGKLPRRKVVYPLVMLFAAILLLLPSFLTNPYRNINAVVQQATSKPQQAIHRSFSAYLARLPEGYTLTIHTLNDVNFFPIEFVTISKVKGKLTVDLIRGPGPENASRLQEEEAQSFLDDHQIDIQPFDDIYE